MRRTLIAALLLIAFGSTPASATVFKCVAADGGITYTNDPSSARNCERLRSDLPISTVPASPQRPATSPQRPAASPQRPAATTSPSFPRVTPDTQRRRDDSRRQILERELNNEQTALVDAQQQLTAQESRDTGPDRLQALRDQVELHQRNIEALERELRGLR